MSVTSHLQIWRQGIYGLAAQSHYVALLASRHGRYLLEHRLQHNHQDTEADKALLKAFSRAQQDWEAGIIDRLKDQPYFAGGCEADRLQANLRLLQVFDWFSLLLCMNKLSETVVVDVPGRTPAQRFDIRLKPTGSSSLTMIPWPFKDAAFTVTVQAHHLTKATFESNEAFQAAWQAAEVKTLVFSLVQSV
jgi:hypothetical protein